MPARDRRNAARRLEAWLWTGPAGHLLGWLLDVAGALARALLGLLARRAPARLRRR